MLLFAFELARQKQSKTSAKVINFDLCTCKMSKMSAKVKNCATFALVFDVLQVQSSISQFKRKQ